MPNHQFPTEKAFIKESANIPKKKAGQGAHTRNIYVANKGPENPVLAAKRMYREEDQKKIQKAANPWLFGALAVILIGHMIYLFAQ